MNILDQPFPIDSILFNGETQCIPTLLSQFLGLYTNMYIIEPLMSLIFVLSTWPIESNEPSQAV